MRYNNGRSKKAVDGIEEASSFLQLMLVLLWIVVWLWGVDKNKLHSDDDNGDNDNDWVRCSTDCWRVGSRAIGA